MGECEVHALCRLAGLVDFSPLACHIQGRTWKPTALLEGNVALFNHPLYEIIQHLGDPSSEFIIALPFSTELLQHLRSQFSTLQERTEHCFLQRRDRGGVLISGPSPVGVIVGASGEASIKEEIGEPLEEGFQVESV